MTTVFFDLPADVRAVIWKAKRRAEFRDRCLAFEPALTLSLQRWHVNRDADTQERWICFAADDCGGTKQIKLRIFHACQFAFTDMLYLAPHACAWYMTDFCAMTHR